MKIGFIGTGNMAQAIIKGIIKNNFVLANDIYCSGRDLEKLKKVTDSLSVNYCENNIELAKQVDVLVLSVKPQLFDVVLPQIKEIAQEKKSLVISIAAGKSLDDISNLIGDNLAIIRTMPNVNATINESVSAITANSNASSDDLKLCQTMFEAIGKVYQLEEEFFPVFAAIGGCSTAFTYIYIDSLARAAVKNGLPKDLANAIAAQATKGSAAMVLESDETPWNLVESVCSPGGTTVAGVVALEDRAFESSIINAVQTAIDRDLELLNKK